MKDFAEPLARLIDELKRLPGIGQKSAQRIAFHLQRAPREEVERLAKVVEGLLMLSRLDAGEIDNFDTFERQYHDHALPLGHIASRISRQQHPAGH